MCGRFSQTRPLKDVADQFQVDLFGELPPRYNIAPTQPVLCVRAAGDGREAASLKWGLIPSWAADASIGPRLLNARLETIREKPAFRTAFAKRRCLIPTDGFYEWEAVGKRKQPIHFRMRDGRLFAFAGLWERWASPEGPVVESCTILTTAANDLLRPYHERMPVILGPERYADWLDPATTDAAELVPWLGSWPAEEMEVVRVNPVVNNARNEGPACWEAA